MSSELVIKVSIADDHKIFRDGIKMALKGREYLKILWEAEDGKDLMHKMQLKKPDVLLMDIRMPGINGVDYVRGTTGYSRSLMRGFFSSGCFLGFGFLRLLRFLAGLFPRFAGSLR